MSVSNEDLRVELTRLTEQVKAAVDITTSVKVAIDKNETKRDLADTRIQTLELEGAKNKGSIAVMRWIVGVVSTAFVSGCIWVFSHVNDADQLNRAQEIRIQALERGQFANTVKER